MNIEVFDYDVQHEEAFGWHTGISERVRNVVTKIKNDEPLPDFRRFNDYLEAGDAAKFSNLAWQLLGQYASGNDHLDDFYLENLDLVDSQMVLICRGLENGIRKLDCAKFGRNPIGITGIRSMGPFLKNSPKLRILSLEDIQDFTTECFEALVEAMNGRGIDIIYLDSCSIKSIAVLGASSLPKLKTLELRDNKISNVSGLENCTQLQYLELSGNPITREGHITIAKLLANKSSSLYHLGLGSTCMSDNELKLYANSLKCNTTLMDINFHSGYKTSDSTGNTTTEAGRALFSPLLNDASSIGGTYNSNHTLREIYFFTTDEWRGNLTKVDVEIKLALKINGDSWRTKNYDHQKGTLAAGRYKVITNQLNSERRKELCHLQGIEFSFDSIFAEIPSMLLPEVLSIVGENHGHNELYRVLLVTAPDLTSLIDRRAMLKELKEKNDAEITALLAKVAALNRLNDRVTRQLTSIDEQRAGDDHQHKLSGKKRGRSPIA